MKNEQLRFQAEMRSKITGIQASQVPLTNKPEGSVNKFVASPSSMAAFIGSESFGQGGKQVEGGSGQLFDGGGYGNFGGQGGAGGMGNGGMENV